MENSTLCLCILFTKSSDAFVCNIQVMDIVKGSGSMSPNDMSGSILQNVIEWITGIKLSFKSERNALGYYFSIEIQAILMGIYLDQCIIFRCVTVLQHGIAFPIRPKNAEISSCCLAIIRKSDSNPV